MIQRCSRLCQQFHTSILNLKRQEQLNCFSPDHFNDTKQACLLPEGWYVSHSGKHQAPGFYHLQTLKNGKKDFSSWCASNLCEVTVMHRQPAHLGNVVRVESYLLDESSKDVKKNATSYHWSRFSISFSYVFLQWRKTKLHFGHM